MWNDPVFLAAALPGALIAGISKGGFGSGAAFVAVPLMALVVEPGVALGVMLPVLMLVDAAALRPYWGRWSWPEARLLVLGGLPGVVIAALVWRMAPGDLFRVLIGGIALAFVAWRLFGRAPVQRPDRPPPGAAVGLAVGVGAGFTSFVSHAGGPAVAVYLLSRGLPKTGYQATTVLVFWALNVAKAAAFATLGLFTAQTLAASAALVPAALLGTALGVGAHRLVPERLFFAITYVLLTAAGGKLIWDAFA